MDTGDQLQMYGVTCKKCGAAVRLGKIWLPIGAQTSDLRDRLHGLFGMVNLDTCPICNADVQFSLDEIRFVADSETPPEYVVNPA